MDLPPRFSPLLMPGRRPNDEASYTLSSHAIRQANAKGWTHDQVLEAATNPHITYENGRYPGQMRHIRENLVAVVHPEKKHVVTVYENVKETDVRPDQTDPDAQAYARKRAKRS